MDRFSAAGDVSNIDQAKIVEMVSSNPLTALISRWLWQSHADVLIFWPTDAFAFWFALNGNWWKDFDSAFLGAFLMLVISSLTGFWVRVETTLFNPLSGPFAWRSWGLWSPSLRGDCEENLRISAAL